MARRPTIDLFCEDAGHEHFLRALVLRLANEAGVPRPTLTPRSVRGGHGRAVAELEQWQRTLSRGAPGCDLLVVIIDANGEGWTSQRRTIMSVVTPGLFPAVVIACPDPHVEAWLAADLGALQRALGVHAPPPPDRPGRHAFKRWLKDALDSGGVEVLTDLMSVSGEVVPEIDLFKAGKASPSLKAAVDEITAFFKRFLLER